MTTSEARIGGGELAQQRAQPVVLEAAGEARIAAAARAARRAVLQRLQAVEDDERALGRDQLRQPHALVVLGAGASPVWPNQASAVLKNSSAEAWRLSSVPWL